MRDDSFDEEPPLENADTGDRAFVSQLRKAVGAIDVSNSLTAPLKQAIETLLKLAADSVGSREASVLVRDGPEGGLKFLTAISDVKEELLKIKIPPGKGIAGLVFATAQPMAVADVSSEGSFWSEADAKTGFKTITVLATPLRTGAEMVGVLEFVNRPGAPPYPPFTPEEMDRAAEFADAIARIVDAFELAELVETLFDRTIKSSLAAEKVGGDFDSDLSEWVNNTTAAPEHRDLMILWVSLRAIVGRGDAERELCRNLLESLARYTEKHSATSVSYSGY